MDSVPHNGNEKYALQETRLQRLLSESNLLKAFRPFLQKKKDVLKKNYIPVRNFNKALFKLEPSSSS